MMFAKHWPWMVSVACPMLAAALGLVWVSVSPPHSSPSHAAEMLDDHAGSLELRNIDQDGDGSISAAEYRDYLRLLVDTEGD